MMKTLVLIALLAVSAFAARSEREYRQQFLNFVRQHGKHYSALEFQNRYSVFKTNLAFVDDWNTKGFHRVAVNKFADLTSEEFTKIYMGTIVNLEQEPLYVDGLPSDIPAAIDWRTRGAVTPVKDQGQCGSCWSFSTTGSTEAAHFFATGNLVSLSEQNLIDCSKKEGNKGCDGGLMTKAMDYIISNKGIDTEASYPYKAKEDWECHYSTANIGATLANYTNVVAGSESDLAAKAALGPVSVAIDASHMSFQLYGDGIYYEPLCSSTQLDHGVLVVGYGTDTTSNADYWIVKNSWAADWGMQGYIQMSRNRNNNCGIASSATLPQA